MLEEIFTVDEMVDNLRIVYRTRSKKETFELMKISNEEGDEVVVPFSKKTAYDMYVIIGKNLRVAFDDAIEKDNEKKQKFREMKLHDSFISEIVATNLENAESNISKLKEAFRDGFLINRTLMEEFKVHKITSIVNDTIKEEGGLLDNYHIGNYLQLYHDVDIDFESILINSVNVYTKHVSDQTKAHYPKINDYGTAYEYFYKVRARTFLTEADNKRGRLYYRNLFNDSMIVYATNKCKKLVRKSVLTMIVICALSLILLSSLRHIRLGIALFGFVFSVTGLDVIIKKRQATITLERFKKNISYENDTLDKLVKAEQTNINRWYQNV